MPTDNQPPVPWEGIPGTTPGGGPPVPWSGIPPRVADVERGARAQLAASRNNQPEDLTGLSNLLNDISKEKPAAPPHGTMAGLGHAAASGFYGMGADISGAGEYVAGKLGAPGAAEFFHNTRLQAQQDAADEVAKLNPDEQQMLQREIFTLDPHKTIFQGGVGQAMHSLALQVAQAAPPTLLSLLPGAKLLKAGMTAGAMTYIGATQAGLSVGAIANNISDDIEHTPEPQLRQVSARYNQLLQQGLDPQSARAQLTQEAQGYAPLIGGLVTGAVASLAGRYLEPALSSEGASLASRIGRGATSQAIQGAGFAGTEQITRDAAAHTYDQKAGPNLQATLEAMGQGASSGAILGGVTTAAMGHAPTPRERQRPPLSTEGVPEEHHTAGSGELRQQPLGNVIDATTQPNAPIWRGADVEAAGRRGWGTGVQGELDFGATGTQAAQRPKSNSGVQPTTSRTSLINDAGVPQDQAAAVRDHFASTETGYIQDMFAEPQVPPGVMTPAGNMMDIAARQVPMDLQGGQMNPTAGPGGFARMSQERGFTMEPQQRELQLRQPRGNVPPEEPGALARMPVPEPSPGPRPEQGGLFTGMLPEHPEAATERQQARSAREGERAVSEAANREYPEGGPEFQRAFQVTHDEFGNPLPGKAEAAQALVGAARELHGEEMARAKWESTGEQFPHPNDVTFEDPKMADKYSDLYHEYAGTEIMKRQAANRGEALKAQAAQDRAARKLTTFLHMNEATTGAERLARVAVGTDKEAVRTALESERARGERPAEPRQRINPEALPEEKPLSRSQVAHLDRDELEAHFAEAVQRAASDRPIRMETGGVHEAVAARIRDAGDQESIQRTVKELTEAHPSPSEKRKFLNRYFQEQRARAARGEVEARTRSEPIAASPRRALTERELARNRAVKRSERTRPQQEFSTEALMSTEESRAAMEESLKKRATREAIRKDLRQKLDATIARTEKAHAQMAKVTAAKMEGASPAMARGYMRELLSYGRRLRETNLVSDDSIHAANTFITQMAKVNKMTTQQRSIFLHGAFKAEQTKQRYQAALANPRGEKAITTEKLAKLSAQKEPTTPPTPEAHLAAVRAEAQAEVEAGHRFERLRAETEARQRHAAEEHAAWVKKWLGDITPPEKPAAEAAPAPEPKGPVVIGGERTPEEAAMSNRFRFGRDFPLEGTPATDLYTNTRRGAATAAKDMEEMGVTHLSAMLPRLVKALGDDHPMTGILRSLQNHGIDSLVGWAPRSEFESETRMGSTRFDASGPRIMLNRRYFENMRAGGKDPAAAILHTIAHESVHVATMKAVMENPGLQREVETMMHAARMVIGKDANGKWLYYGLVDPAEFVAEGFTNAKFQNELKNIRIQHIQLSVWDRFTSFVRRVLGLSEKDTSQSLLEGLMSRRDELFSRDEYHPVEGEISKFHERFRTEGRTHVDEMNLDDQSKNRVGNILDRTLQSVRTEAQVRERYGDATEAVKNGLLGLTSPRQMADAFAKYFVREDGTNPYTKYWDTFFRRNADNNAMMEKVGHFANKWSNLEDKYGVDVAHTFSTLLHDATLYGIHPDVPVDVVANEHLVSPEQRVRHGELSETYKALPEEYRQHYQTLKNYYARTQREATDQIVINSLHSMLTKGEDAPMTAKEFDAKYTAADVRKLGLNTEEGLQREFGDKLDASSQKLIAKIGSFIEKPNGPYFPLMRNGDYVVTANRHIEAKTFADGKGASAYEAAQREKDPTLSVSRVRNDDGSVTVNTREREVRMAESKAAARAHVRELNEKYGAENVSPIQLRADLYQPKADITTGSALDRIINELSDNPAAQTAVKDFYLRSLAEQSFRKRELTRSNVRGVDVENQKRSFVQYGRSSSYYLSQLRHGRALANAMGDIQSVVREHTDESEITATRLGAIAREISRRDEISRNPYEVNKLAKFATNFTQFAMMTSVSHWFVRGSQPYMLSVPWLAARHGYGASMAAMSKAQGLIASPLIRESVDSMAGLRTLLSKSAAAARSSAEKTYTVLDQVMAHIKDSKNPRAAEYNSMLQDLRDNGIIDLSMATELKDIAQGKDAALTARVLDSSRAMLHLVEVNNRAMTAVAAYDLARNKGSSAAEATKFARDAVAITHNDYSYGNTPRAFMAQQGLLGGARAAMTQFMRYPQHVYAMLVSAVNDAMHGASAEEKRVGYKTLAGILGTHLAAAGALGVAVQPIKWAIGLAAFAASASGATSQPFSFANAFTGEAYDRLTREATNELFGTDLGQLVAGGLPRLAGVDLSQRLSLGTMYFTHMNTDSNASIIGSLVESFGGPWLSELEAIANGAKDFSQGKVGQGLEQVSPHLIRDILMAGRYADTGLQNNAGNTLIPASQMTAGELFARSIGFNPVRFADKMQEKASLDDIQRQLQGRASDLSKRYAAAAPEDRQAMLDEIREFNKEHPGFAITRSSLIRAQQSKLEADRQLQTYGARMRAKAIPEMRQYGAIYGPVGSQ